MSGGATPRPWGLIVELDGRHAGLRSMGPPDCQIYIGETTSVADARLIVRAVNAHEELVAMVRRVVFGYTALVQSEFATRRYPHPEDDLAPIQEAKALLARLEAEETP